MNSFVNRRSVLKVSGLLVVTFSLVPRFTFASPSGAEKPVTPDLVESYLAIGADGRITVYSGKVDLGTGLYVPRSRRSSPMSSTCRSAT
jgi:nicotinate dehydrogenase subunit B